MDARAEAIYQSYEYITQYTNIGYKQMKKYTDISVELDMITVASGYMQYKETSNGTWKEASNIYVINNLHDGIENVLAEIKLCKKQYRYVLEEKGYIVK